MDVGHVDDRTRDPIKVGRLLRSLARHVATQASSATIGVDTVRADGVLARDTVSEYLSALERLMIVEDQPAWSTHLRFKIAHPRGPKRHFVDPSLAVATRRATPDRLLANLYLVGLLFTSLNDATMLHY